MYAIVENGSITSTIKSPQGISINGTQYSAKIFSLWSTSQLEAIGIYEVEYDNSNKKNAEYYTNGNQTLSFENNKAVLSYGEANPKKLDDTLYVDGDKIPSGKSIGDVATKGLKSQKKELINQQTNVLLHESDWMVIKATETDVSIDASWKTYRASVRTKCNTMQSDIDSASDVDALEAMFTYAVDSDGNVTRPLGELPQKE